MTDQILAMLFLAGAALMIIPLALFARWLELKFDLHGEREKPAE